MIDLLRRYDWSATPLGARADWPFSLRTTVDLMMASGHAMCLASGPERTLLYNDAYAAVLGARHPAAFGMRLEEIWSDVWSEIGPLVARTFAGETATFHDMPLTMTRNGFPEQTWWSFSYSPVRDDRGAVAGLLNVTTETTGRVIAEQERDKAIAELRRSEGQWRRLFETMEEGFILGAVLRDDAGRIIDWRYEEVNDAWYDLVGIARGGAIGRTIREVFPGIEDEWVLEFASVVEAGEPVRFTRQVGSLGRWYDGVAKAAGGDYFTVLFTEVTDRVRREQRQSAIITLGDRLQALASVDDMVAATATILADSFEVPVVDYDDIEAGAASVAIGGMVLTPFVEDLRAGRAIMKRDGMAPFVVMPVVERGTLVALLHVSSAAPRDWSAEEVQFLRDVAHRLRAAVERLRAAERQEILNGELSHRVKNTLSVVQAIAMQTLSSQIDRGSMEAFGNRLKALAAAHDVLLTRSWAAAEIADVVQATLASFPADRVRVNGPELPIGARTAMSLSLLIHELATNAVKHGALSVPAGHVLIDWAINEGQLEMRWVERGGPPAIAPTRRGFGSRIINMGLTGSGDVKLHYASDGLTVEMTAPVRQVQQA
ncbi:PAS domain-containing sensor histidine kinase [Sphingomonas phyllosphaerae]|uniref:PAS domain-containing sensor histidine kinase n=1 Tax=Sphingomonas phyllosphaerae TaxID=257003 RepID=UPI0018CB41C2|nr:HWE histidine kinase domain-containing protein [Sphingomonas phyllosphaerae]